MLHRGFLSLICVHVLTGLVIHQMTTRGQAITHSYMMQEHTMDFYSQKVINMLLNIDKMWDNVWKSSLVMKQCTDLCIRHKVKTSEAAWGKLYLWRDLISSCFYNKGVRILFFIMCWISWSPAREEERDTFHSFYSPVLSFSALNVLDQFNSFLLVKGPWKPLCDVSEWSVATWMWSD